MTYLAIFMGGLVGGILRYLCDLMFAANHSFPIATLMVNLLGSLALGLFYGMADSRQIPPWLRAGFGTGMIGAFTTFSTFCFNITQLMSSNLSITLLFTALSLVGGPALAYLGTVIVTRVSRQPVTADAGDLSA